MKRTYPQLPRLHGMLTKLLYSFLAILLKFQKRYTLTQKFRPNLPPSSAEVEETAFLLQTPSDKRPPPKGPFPWAEGRGARDISGSVGHKGSNPNLTRVSDDVRCQAPLGSRGSFWMLSLIGRGGSGLVAGQPRVCAVVLGFLKAIT